jgi:hypothetical protein
VSKLLELLGKLPTTEARIAVTLVLAIGTAARYFAGGWEPSLDWLGFLVVWAGLDVAQFASKLVTDHTYAAVRGGSAPPPKEGA